MSDLEGIKAVVTGGGAGIGRAVVERFVAEGATVAALDLDVSSLLPPVHAYVCNVADDGTCSFDSRPVHMYTLSKDVDVVPPKPRVY